MQQVEIYRLSELDLRKKQEAAKFITKQFEDEFRHLFISQEKIANLLEAAMVESRCMVAFMGDHLVGIVTVSTIKYPALVISRKRAQKILGYGHGWLFYFKMMQDSLPNLPNTLYISTLAVDERYRRQGIATQLLRWVMLKYPNMNYLLEVSNSNKRAIKLYESLGFQIFKYKKKRTLKKDELKKCLYIKWVVN